MVAQGTPFETPRACPFVALEHDRDQRSDRPDYRHRCFAEPTPAPRSIAHQEAYCLSPSFSACPVFQDWAVRAAARPVPGEEAAAVSGAASMTAAESTLGSAGVGAPSAAQQETAADAPHAADNLLPEDASVTTAGAEIAAAAAASTGIASPPTFATTGWDDEAQQSEQLGVFDDAEQEPDSSLGAPDAGYPEPPPTPAFVPPPSRQQPEAAPADDAATAAAAASVPAFLAGRSTRPATTPPAAEDNALPPPRPAQGKRDDIVPSWDVDGRYGAQPVQSDEGGSRLDTILTAIAVVAILAIGVAAVLFLPGLLNRGKGPTTPAPSAVVQTTLPSAVPTAPASLAPSVAPSAAPTVAPSSPPSAAPAGSPRTYKIKAGDSLARIANRYGVSVQDILDANPGITNPNNIFVGQVIVIPAPTASSPSP